MDHKHYEKWILSDEQHPPEVLRTLNDHLTRCAGCRRVQKNWQGVESVLRNQPVIAPRPGFSSRWGRRLKRERRRQRAKQLAAMLAGTGSAALLFFFIFISRLLAAAGDLVAFYLVQVQAITYWYAAFQPAVSAAGDLARSIPGPAFPTGVVAFFSVIGAGGIAWLKMLRTLARYQGFTRWA